MLKRIQAIGREGKGREGENRQNSYGSNFKAAEKMDKLVGQYKWANEEEKDCESVAPTSDQSSLLNDKETLAEMRLFQKRRKG